MSTRSSAAGSLPAEAKTLIAGAKANAIDTSVLLSDLIDCFGGPSMLAKAIHQEFICAKAGSMVRTRTMEMLTRLVLANTQMDLASLKKASDMDDDELEQQALRLLGKSQAQGLTNASKEAGEADEA